MACSMVNFALPVQLSPMAHVAFCMVGTVCLFGGSWCWLPTLVLRLRMSTAVHLLPLLCQSWHGMTWAVNIISPMLHSHSSSVINAVSSYQFTVSFNNAQTIFFHFVVTWRVWHFPNIFREDWRAVRHLLSKNLITWCCLVSVSSAVCCHFWTTSASWAHSNVFYYWIYHHCEYCTECLASDLLNFWNPTLTLWPSLIIHYYSLYHFPCDSIGRDRVVGIGTRHGLDSSGIESLWGQRFLHPSRPALGPTQPRV